MNYISAINIEMKKIRRSKILLLLLVPVLMMWIPSLVNSDMIFDVRDIPITPERNFFIQGFMGMAWFMLPASIVICTVLLTRTELSHRGIVKMLSLPVSRTKLFLAKYTVLVFLIFVQMAFTVLAYFICAAAASRMHGCDLVLSPAYVLGSTFRIYASALPMAAVFWMLSVLIPSPIFSVGIGLASIVPSVLVINTEFWYAYPVSYPFYFLMVEYGRAAEGVYETGIDWIPLIPAALLITAAALLIACIRFQRSQKV